MITLSRKLVRKKQRRSLLIIIALILCISVTDYFFMSLGESKDNIRTVSRTAHIWSRTKIDSLSAEEENNPKYHVMSGFLLGLISGYASGRIIELLFVLMCTEFFVLISMVNKGWIVFDWRQLGSLLFNNFKLKNIGFTLVSNFVFSASLCIGIYCGRILSNRVLQSK